LSREAKYLLLLFFVINFILAIYFLAFSVDMEDHSSSFPKSEQPSLPPGVERQETQCAPTSEEKNLVAQSLHPSQTEGREVASPSPPQLEGKDDVSPCPPPPRRKEVFDAASNLQQQQSKPLESQSTSQPCKPSKKQEESYGLLQQFPDPNDKIATNRTTVE
jgi:hypothetical protein